MADLLDLAARADKARSMMWRIPVAQTRPDAVAEAKSDVAAILNGIAADLKAMHAATAEPPRIRAENEQSTEKPGRSRRRAHVFVRGVKVREARV